MKQNLKNRLQSSLLFPVSFAVVAVLGSSAFSARAATLTWDTAPGTVGLGNGTINGGAGNWTTTPTLGNWTSDGGANNVAWVNNAAPDSAIFQGTGGVVTQADISVNSITFSNTGYSVTGGTLTLAGVSPKVTAAADATISSVIGGSAGLAKDGAGRLRIDNANTFSGDTNVTGTGRLEVLGSLRNTTSMNVGSAATLELAATNILVGGHGTPVPSSVAITVNGGTLLMPARADFRIGNLTLNDGATWTSTRDLANYGVLLGITTSGVATITVSGAGASLMNGSGGIHLQGVQNFTVADTTASSATDLTVNMILANPGPSYGANGGVNKTGGGTMVLNRVNTYLGATIVNGGTLVIGADGSITDSDVTVNGGTFRPDVIGKTVKSLTVNDGATLVLPADEYSPTGVSGSFTSAGTVTVRPVFAEVPAAGDVAYLLGASTIVGAESLTLDLDSRGTTRVTGTLSVESERDLLLTIDTGAANLVWSNSAGSKNWNVATDANFQNGAAADVFKIDDAVTFGDTGAGNIDLMGTLYASAVTVDSTSDYTFSGPGTLISGDLTKAGTSTLTLATSVSPRNVILTGGTLDLATTDGIGAGTINIDTAALNNSSGGLLTLNNPQMWGNSVTLSGDPMTLAGSVLMKLPTELTVTSDVTISGSVDSSAGLLVKKGSGSLTLNGGVASLLSEGLDVQAGTVLLNTATAASSISVGTGATPATLMVDGAQVRNRVGAFATITVGGNGTMIAYGVNSLPDGTAPANIIIEAGGLVQMVSGGSMVTGAGGTSHHHIGNLTLNGGTLKLVYSGAGEAYSNESFQLDTNLTVGGTTPSLIRFGAGATLANAGFALSNTPHTFNIADVTNSPAADLVIDAEMEDFDGKNGYFVKTGTGTMALVGGFNHSYTGPTTIAEGTLIGTGSIASQLTVQAAGAISPGNPVGSFATKNATIAGTFAYDVDGVAADSLVVNGNLNLTGSTLALNVMAGGATQANYVIATFTGNRVGEFTIPVPLPDGFTVTYDDAGKRVLLSSGSESTFDAYMAAFPGAAGASGFSQDADNDGISNGIESVLGTDPTANTAGLTQVAATANSVTFRHTLNNDLPSDVTYQYQWSSDLAEWKASGVANGAGTLATIVATTVDDNAAPLNDVIEVTATRTGTASSKLFVRLVAEN